jgi:S1-C subfamily serine protease
MWLKRIIASLFFAVCLFTCQRDTVYSTPLNKTEASKLGNDSVVFILVKRVSDGNLFSFGTGVKIDCIKGQPVHILTAYHVIDIPFDAVFAYLEADDNFQTPKLIYTQSASPKYDLAYLEGMEVSEKTIHIRFDKTYIPSPGREIMHVGGNVLTMSPVFGFGQVTTDIHKAGDGPSQSTNIRFMPGHSGGPVFDILSGNLIGIVKSFDIQIYQTLTIIGESNFVPSIYIGDFLDFTKICVERHWASCLQN